MHRHFSDRLHEKVSIPKSACAHGQRVCFRNLCKLGSGSGSGFGSGLALALGSGSGSGSG